MTAAGLVLQSFVSDWTRTAVINILGFGLYACVVATGVAFLYRGYSTRAVPIGAAVLLGVSFVAISLNIESALEPALVEDTPKLHYATATYLLGVFSVSAVASEGGRRLGDHFACDVFGIERLDARGEVARLVRSAGLVLHVDLPETIDDLDGYASVDDAVKRELAGRTVRFPRRLSPDELESRLAERLERDFDVGHVHAEVADDGAVEALAVGDRPSGLSPSLPPQTVAVAVDGDPSPDASTGDPVEVWTADGESSQLVATGTFRAAVGDVATVTVAEDAVDAFERGGSYRLLTRPDAANDIHELVSLIWNADETVTTVTVGRDDALQGEFVGWLPARVLVLERDDDVLPFPDENETLRVGDTAYVLGSPVALRELAEYEPREDADAPSPADEADPEGDEAAVADD